MSRVLLTAFEPYDRWKSNASWLALVQLTQHLPDEPQITTRLYPVDFAEMKERLAADLSANFDYALHVGQAPGSSRIQLEAIGLNIGGSSSQSPDQYRPLSDDGPVAYRSDLPLADWAVKLRRAGVPAQVSYHAGNYLCNATLYWSHYLIERMALATQTAFIHVPLDVSQVVNEPHGTPSLPVTIGAQAIRLILEELA
jgi:pyroglutamyl-peptidase